MKRVGELHECYLENNVSPFAFTSDRIAVSELLASQAAISLKNASLYSDLQRSEVFLTEARSLSHSGSFGWNLANGEISWSAETYNIFEYDRAAKPTLRWCCDELIPTTEISCRRVSTGLLRQEATLMK